MPIPVITNFSINDTKPMDDRFVATSSVTMNNIQFKYPGLTVYRTDENKNYQYDGSNWAIFSSGIYGGSGLLAGDVVVDTTADSTQRDSNTYGTPGTLGYQNLDFIISASSSTNNRSYVRHFFRTKEEGVLATSQEYVIAFQGVNDPLSTDYSGIKFNSSSGLGGNGAVAIWTTTLESDTPSSLRFIVEDSGSIRFKPRPDILSFLSITGKFGDVNTIHLGYNWDGSSKLSERLISGIGASYIEFNAETISFYNLKSSSTTAFKTLTINEDSLTAFKNFFVSSPGNFIGLSTGGFRSGTEGTIGSLTVYNYIIFRTGTATTDVIRYNSSSVRVLKDIEIGSVTTYSPSTVLGNSSALSTYGPLNARYYVNMWDNKFVSDPSDNQWVYNTEESVGFPTSDFNQGTGTVRVVQEQYSGQSQDFYFQMIPRSYAAAFVSKSIWELSSQPYDRMIYFHLDHLDNATSPKNFTHHLSWYLTDEAPVALPLKRAWKKIGKLETGNRNGINMMSASYSVPYYSQQVLVPANMYMKLIFKFPYSIPTVGLEWPATEAGYQAFVANLPILVVTSIRSGVFNTTKFSRGPIDSISGTDYLKDEMT